MSTKLRRVGKMRAELAMAASLSMRSSGTATSPILGSMVQNGKLAACAEAVRVKALKRVDFPTLGNPTIPQRKPITLSFSIRLARTSMIAWRARLYSGNWHHCRLRVILYDRRGRRACTEPMSRIY